MFRDLLAEMKGFKYQATVTPSLKKRKQAGGLEFAPAFFNSTNKTVINFKYDHGKFFQEVF